VPSKAPNHFAASGALINRVGVFDYVTRTRWVNLARPAQQLIVVNRAEGAVLRDHPVLVDEFDAGKPKSFMDR